MNRKLQDPLLRAMNKAIRESPVGQLQKLLEKERKWSRRVTIARNKLAEVRWEINGLALRHARVQRTELTATAPSAPFRTDCNIVYASADTMQQAEDYITGKNQFCYGVHGWYGWMNHRGDRRSERLVWCEGRPYWIFEVRGISTPIYVFYIFTPAMPGLESAAFALEWERKHQTNKERKNTWKRHQSEKLTECSAC